MNLYFPIWLAYVVYAIAFISLLWLMIVLLAKLVSESIDYVVKRAKVTRAFVAFLVHSELRKEFGTIAEIRQELNDVEKKLKLERDRINYQKHWALYHLYLATGGKVAENFHSNFYHDDNENHQWAEVGWKSCAQMESEFNEWLASKLTPEPDQKAGESA